MSGLSRCVVDASVGIKLLVEEELSDAAESLFMVAASSPDARAYVPDLFFVECANVLWKYVLRHGYSRRDALRNLSELQSLHLVRIPTPTLTEAALRIAIDLSVSVYDACYVAAADSVDAPLVTADERLIGRLARSRHRVCHLVDAV